MARKVRIADGVWIRWTLLVLAGLLVLREGINATGIAPVHFDEAQYWTYGEAPAFGYYSKPPLVAWLIRASTEVFGDTLFGLRFFSPLIHAWIGWLIFAAGRRFFDARLGFWAALGYSVAPGVSVSASLMTTDPPMMLGWAGALYALARLLPPRPKRAPPPAFWWWGVLGACLGAGMLAKYTAGVFVAGALGYALLSREGAVQWRGPLLAAGAFLLVWAPNLAWLAIHDFASLAHLSENADTGRGFSPEGLPEFLAAQVGVIGPVILAGLGWGAWRWRDWRGDWRMRLLAWLSAPLLLAMAVQSLNGGANANWAAPVYVGGSVFATAWLLSRGALGGLRAQVPIGAAAVVLLVGLSAVYAAYGPGLPRAADPLKKSRVSGPLCERLGLAMEETGVDLILSDDRRRLAECSFLLGLTPGQIRVWNPRGRVSNHYEMTASLTGDEDGPMLLLLLGRDGARETARFAAVEQIDAGEVAPHVDARHDYGIWRVEGFRGY